MAEYERGDTVSQGSLPELEGLDLEIPEGVFAPTATSGVLIRSVVENESGSARTLDLGCGTGAVGLALVKAGVAAQPFAASDASQAAVDATIRNAKRSGCSVDARCGPLFDPWLDVGFDVVVDDVSGVAEEVASISPWFSGVPCESGPDGDRLVTDVIRQAPGHLKPGGRIYFPIVSFSKAETILGTAEETFESVEKVGHEAFPLPLGMYDHRETLGRMREEGRIDFSEKFGMILFWTDVYCAAGARI